jgi:hypothetical protein
VGHDLWSRDWTVQEKCISSSSLLDREVTNNEMPSRNVVYLKEYHAIPRCKLE